MEDLERAADADEYGTEPRVVAAMVIYEVCGTDEDGDTTSIVGCRCTDDRNILGLGMLARATEALIRPDA